MENLCQYKHLSCFGCCGHTWGSKRQVLRQIDKNTKAFKEMSKEEFKNRSEEGLSECGGCKSIICKKGAIVCGLHPLQNKGADYRDKNCNKSYLCETYKKFIKWPKERQKQFLNFIESKKLNHYTYSMGMDSDKFLKEFERKYG